MGEDERDLAGTAQAALRQDRRQLLAAIAGAAAGTAAFGAGPRSAQAQIFPGQAAGAAVPKAPLPVEVAVAARPITQFSRTDAGHRQFGRLEFRGGLVLTSAAADFGGWSGLVLDDTGHFLMISDRGSWMTGELLYEGPRPRGIRNATLGPIVGVGGRPLGRQRDRDSESVTLLDGSLSRGTVLVSFEVNHRIGRFGIGDRGLEPPVGYLKMPAEVKRLSRNKGFESVSVIRGGALKGSIIAFAEEYFDPRRNHTGWVWVGGIAAEPQKLGLTNIDDFAITDVASLPDGSLVVLERKFRWLEGVRMRMRLVKAAQVRPGALLDGEVLMEADLGSEIDNMEALSIHRDARGKTVLTVVSDDNFNHFLQRTILLQFALPDTAKPASPL